MYKIQMGPGSVHISIRRRSHLWGVHNNRFHCTRSPDIELHYVTNTHLVYVFIWILGCTMFQFQHEYMAVFQRDESHF